MVVWISSDGLCLLCEHVGIMFDHGNCDFAQSLSVKGKSSDIQEQLILHIVRFVLNKMAAWTDVSWTIASSLIGVDVLCYFQLFSFEVVLWKFLNIGDMCVIIHWDKDMYLLLV